MLRAVWITFCLSLFVVAPAWAQQAKQPTAAAKAGYLGVDVTNVTKDEADALGWDAPRGAKVVSIRKDSPAERAGFQKDDIITSIDREEVDNQDAFTKLIVAKGAGTEINVRYRRSGRERRLAVTLAEQPQEVLNKPGDGRLHLMIDPGGHTAIIRGMAFTPDGNYLVSAGDDKTIRIWNLRTGQTERIIRGEIEAGHGGKIYGLALSPDGRWLAVGGYIDMGDPQRRFTTRIYNLQTGRLARLLFGHTSVINGVAFAPDSRHLATAGYDKNVVVWDLGPNPDDPKSEVKLLHTLKGHTEVIYSVGFSPDSQRVVSGSDDTTLRMWEVKSGRLIAQMTGHKGEIDRALAVNPVDGTIASGDSEGELRLWDGRTGRFIRTIARAKNPIGRLVFTPDGKKLIATCPRISCNPNGQVVWDVATGKAEFGYIGHTNIVLAAAVTNDGRTIATGGGNDRAIHVWDLATGKPRKDENGRDLVMAGSGRPPFVVGFSGDGNWIGWGRTDNGTTNSRTEPYEFRMRLPTTAKDDKGLGEPEAVGQKGGPTAFIRAQPKFGSLELNHRAGGVLNRFDGLLDVKRDGNTVATIERGTSDGIRHRAYGFTPDGRTIISGGANGTLEGYDTYGVIDKAKGGVLKGNDLYGLAKEYVGHFGDMWSIAVSPDGKRVISGNADQTVRIWNRETQELVATLFHAVDGQWVMWTPQGYFTGSEGAGQIIGWQLNRGYKSTPAFFEASQLRQRFYRPDIIEEALRINSAQLAIQGARGTDFRIEDLQRRPPPSIKINAPTSYQLIRGGSAILQVQLEATPDPIKKLSVRVNGRVVAEQAPNSGEGEVAFNVPLGEGKNKITVVASNAVGDTPVDVTVVHEGKGLLDKRGTLYLVSIGVNDYSAARGKLKNLSYTGQDATAFAEAAQKALGRQHADTDVKLLTADSRDGPPTASNIRKALSRVRNLATENDTVIVFVAGHGVNDRSDYLFLATDARPQGSGWEGDTVVPWVELERIVYGTRGRRFLFVDTCHSAGAYNAKLGTEAFNNDVTAFTATGQDELAVELQALGRGVFSYAISRGLGNDVRKADYDNDGVVRVEEFARYLRDQTRQLINAHWPNFEVQTGGRVPQPRLFRARDAENHVLASLQ